MGKEKEDFSDSYIGDICAQDVYAYVNIPIDLQKVEKIQKTYWAYESPLVLGLREHKIGNTPFCRAAAFTATLWYAYRGMIREAVFFDSLSMVLGGILLHFSWIAGLVLLALLAIIKGFLALPLYYLRIRNAVEQRGLLMRGAELNMVAAESLKKEGKPSVPRAVLYLFLKCFTAVCLDSVLFSVFAVLGI